MNSLVKKMLVFLMVMAVVGVAGWFARKAYKHHTEHREVARATEYLDKKDVRNAALCLQRALQINPMSVEASKGMADLLDSAGVASALGWRVRVAQLQPANMTNRLLWAQTAIKLKDFSSASNAFAGLDDKSKSWALYYKLSGAMAWSLGKGADADRDYRKALTLEPTNMAIILNLDTMGLSSSNKEVAAAARRSLESVATNSEYRMVALRELALDSITRKEYSKAAGYSSEIIHDPAATVMDKVEYLQLLRSSDSPNYAAWLGTMKQNATTSPEVAFALGKWMARADNSATALHWLQTLPVTVQTNQPVPLVMADCFIEDKNWKGLIAMVDKQDWGDANCFRLALTALGERSLQQDAAAQLTWHKALRASSHKLDRMSRLAQVTAQWKWDAENTEVLNEISTEFPKEKWAAELLMNKFYAEGNTKGLADLIAKIYESDSSNPKLKNNMASISLLRKAKLEEAHRLAREAYDSETNNPFFASTYAYSLLLQNKQADAVKIFNSVDPKYLKIPAIAAYYGVVQAQSGHKDAAKAPLELAATAKLLPEEREIVRQAQARL
jgi:Flp pilus assembly protein TadD